MFAGRLTKITLRALDWLAATTLPPEDIPAHQRTGRRGEEDAYFYFAGAATPSSLATTVPPIIAANWISSAGIGTSFALSK